VSSEGVPGDCFATKVSVACTSVSTHGADRERSREPAPRTKTLHCAASADALPTPSPTGLNQLVSRRGSSLCGSNDRGLR
jgi:hypothetical protein